MGVGCSHPTSAVDFHHVLLYQVSPQKRSLSHVLRQQSDQQFPAQSAAGLQRGGSRTAHQLINLICGWQLQAVLSGEVRECHSRVRPVFQLSGHTVPDIRGLLQYVGLVSKGGGAVHSLANGSD